MANITNSSGINSWAKGYGLELVWEVGADLRGWARSDGARAIETNGDPIFDQADGFEAAWAAQSL